MTTLSVVVSSQPEVDFFLFDCWVAGDDVEEASVKRKEYGSLPTLRHVILNDTRDQYQLFELLTPFLNQPTTIARQDIFVLSEADQATMINKYYSYSSKLMQHIVGKQLSKGLKKDLDEVAEKINHPLSSCNRQFDNLKRIFKAVEDEEGQLDLLIAKEFLLERAQAEDYAAMVFITNNRLAIDKKVLADVPFSRFIESAREFMKAWTSIAEPHGDDQDLHKKFLQDMREIKYAVLSAKIMQELASHVLESATQQDPSSMAKMHALLPVIKSLVQIGGGLSNRGEWRDIFEDLMDQVVAACDEVECTVADVEVLIAGVRAAFPHLSLSADVMRRTRNSYDTYFSTIGNVIVILLSY